MVRRFKDIMRLRLEDLMYILSKSYRHNHRGGTGQENADFILTIPKTGSYQITVTGHQAEGKVSFVCFKNTDGIQSRGGGFLS